MRGELTKVGEKPPLVIKHDVLADQVTINGVKFSGDFFRTFAAAGALPSRPFRICKGKDGVVVLMIDAVIKSQKVH